MTDEQIDRLRREKWARFRTKAGMADDAPFVGEPMNEYVEEQLDALNYLDVERVRAELACDAGKLKVLDALVFLSRQALRLIEIETSPIAQRDSKLVLPN